MEINNRQDGSVIPQKLLPGWLTIVRRSTIVHPKRLEKENQVDAEGKRMGRLHQANFKIQRAGPYLSQDLL